MEAYCVKCKAKREMRDPTPVFMTNGRPATRGRCPECDTGMFKIGHTPAHDDLDIAGNIHGLSGRLVIVESPAKARTVGRFLGDGYKVRASVGHIRDLPSNRMGVAVENDFEPRYIVPSKKKQVVRELRLVAKKAAEIYLATDPDREGEAISWHLVAALGAAAEHKPIHRVEFHEITQEAIGHAFAHPREIDMHRVDAQQARRVLDRLVGYTMSPLLREKMRRKGLSAGRVQSVALRLIVEREREIEAFEPTEYWSLEADLAKKPAEPEADQQSFLAKLHRIQGREIALNSAEDVQPILDALESADYTVTKVRRGERRRHPSPPYTTSTMQQEAVRRLGFTTKRSMAIAQQLYQGVDIEGEPVGLITYMRTDSVNVSEAAQQQAREYIQGSYGDRFVPDQPPKYKTKIKGAQEAHEAVRPTSVLRTPKSIRQHLDRDQYRLYTLIWQRFVASQMSSAVYDTVSVDIVGTPDGLAGSGRPGPVDNRPNPMRSPYLFRASGSQVIFPGFLAVYEEARDEDADRPDGETEARTLPPLAEGEPLDLMQLLPHQHFTQPPPRYTEASLVRLLEEYGIGRPSTYAPTISTIQARHFVTRQDKRLYPTEVGVVVNDLLVKHFDDYINVGFTTEMETQLDQIAGGERDWVAMLEAFYSPYAATVERARKEMPEVIMGNNPTGELCEKCAEPLIFKYGRNGLFIGCSNYPDCRNTKPILKPTGAKCPDCGDDLVEKRTGRGRLFFGCAAYDPDDDSSCRFSLWKRPLPQICPACGGLLTEVKGGQAQCYQCEQAFPKDALPPAPKAAEPADQPQPTIVFVPVDSEFHADLTTNEN